MDANGKSDPYLVMNRTTSDLGGKGNIQTIYTSETMKKSLDVVWKQITLTVEELCGSE